MMLDSLLLIIGVTTSLGAEPKSRILSESDYRINEETSLYDHLPYGSYENLFTFQRAQARRLQAGIFDPSDSNKFLTTEFCVINEGETLEEAALRIFNKEMAKRTNVVEGRSLEVKYYFTSPIGLAAPQFFGRMYFIPTRDIDGTYSVPQSITNSLDLQIIFDAKMIDIWWPNITRATLVVQDQSETTIYKGDTLLQKDGDEFSVRPGRRLIIPGRFLTNNTLNVTLTVTLKNGVNAVYVNGVRDTYVKNNPVLTMKITDTKPIISIVGGAPLQEMILRKFTDLNLPPQEVSITLDSTGSATWIDNSPSSIMGFYSLSSDGE